MSPSTTTVVRHPAKSHTREGKAMVLTIKRLTPTVTQRYRTGDGATAPTRLDKTASAKSAPPVEIVRPTESVWLVVLEGSKLNRARRNAPTKGTRITTKPLSQELSSATRTPYAKSKTADAT